MPVSEQYPDVLFIPKDQTIPDAEYVIPEAFTFGDGVTGIKQLSGYWASKYEMSPGSTPIMEGTIGVRNDSIKAEIWKFDYILAGTSNVEFYLDGILKETNHTGEYTYTGLTQGSEHTINIIARDTVTNEYIGALTREIKVQGPNEPDLSGFNPTNTYFVMYDGSGNEIDPGKTDPGSKIQLDANGKVTNAPTGWYDYADKEWANVVTINGSKKAYWVWVPRYAYRNLYKDSITWATHSDIVWLNGTDSWSEVPPGGYVIPEAFQFGDVNTGVKELTGYWASKYEVSP